MVKQIDKSNLGYLGIDFQYKLSKIFIEDTKFFEDVISIVDQNSFTEPLLRNFIGVIKDYYQNKGQIPTYSIINTILNTKAKTPLEIEENNAFINKIANEITTEGCSIYKEETIKFFKQQNLIKVANKILETVSKGSDNVDECKKILEEALMVGQEDDFGYNIYDLKEKALSNTYTVSIPTGIEKLDEVLGGGLDKGKLGLIIAPPGFGKTSLTTAIDSFAATYKCDINNNNGFKVLQIYFEDDDVDITRKHFSRITKVEARHFKRLNEAEKQDISSWLENIEDKELLKKNLRLKRFKTSSKSASDIGIFVKKLINSGFKPDLISIDYFECLAPEKGGYASDTEWTREGITMRTLENLAHEINCAIWLPTQGTKDSINSPDFIRMDQATGSGKKIHVAQLILSIARALNDIENNLANLAILKNRSGKSGKIFKNIKFDNGTSTISCDEVIEYNDELAWKKDFEEESEKQKYDYARKIMETKRQLSYYEKTTNDSEDEEKNVIGRIKE